MLLLTLPLPDSEGKTPIQQITRVAPKDWPKERQEALRPMWRDKDGKPLPWDKPLCDQNGIPMEPERLTT